MLAAHKVFNLRITSVLPYKAIQLGLTACIVANIYQNKIGQHGT